MSYSQYSQNPYQQDGPPQGGAYGGYQQENPYANDQQYEMQDYNNNNNNDHMAQPAPASGMSQQDFLNRVQRLRDDIRGLTSDVDYIGQLHQRTLGSTDGQANDQLQQFVAQTQVRNTAIKDGIKGLERDVAKTNDTSRATKNTHLESLKSFFKAELEKYRAIERDYEHRYREQIGRQYRIVNPSASEDEVQQAMSTDWGNEGVFQTALRTNRTGHASSVLGNVRARHNELQRIEQTITELNVLFEELATVIEQQEPVIQAAEDNAINTTQNLEKGIGETDKAKEHAARARRLKWWCLLVVVLIILAVALGVGLGVGLAQNSTS